MKKVALITGASSGIGRCLSISLASNGFYSIMASRDLSKLKAVKSIIDANGDSSLAVELDICDENSVRRLYSTVSDVGTPDIIINNAGVGIFSSTDEISIQDWNNQIDTNLTGPFLIVREFISDMKKRNSGTLVFINSVAGRYGYPFSQGYVSSKFGLRGLADSLRNELRENNIKVISIYPGAINTPFWDKSKSNFPRDEMLSSESVSKVIISNILSEDNLVVEDMIIRRTEGDF